MIRNIEFQRTVRLPDPVVCKAAPKATLLLDRDDRK